jgi:hypothetical protein
MLIVLAKEFEFLRLIREGRLPFEPVWENYAVPTGKHLVMKSPGANLTINQVEWPHVKPRKAAFRDQLAVPNTDAAHNPGLLHNAIAEAKADSEDASLADQKKADAQASLDTLRGFVALGNQLEIGAKDVFAANDNTQMVIVGGVPIIGLRSPASSQPRQKEGRTARRAISGHPKGARHGDQRGD